MADCTPIHACRQLLHGRIRWIFSKPFLACLRLPAEIPQRRSEPGAEHLKDGGLEGAEFIKAIDGGTLPQVSFYKPQGNLNEHPGYTAVLPGDLHIAELITHLQK